MHDFHIKEHNLAELLRIDPGGFIIVWPPEDKPKVMQKPLPPQLRRKGAELSLERFKTSPAQLPPCGFNSSNFSPPPPPTCLC